MLRVWRAKYATRSPYPFHKSELEWELKLKRFSVFKSKRWEKKTRVLTTNYQNKANQKKCEHVRSVLHVLIKIFDSTNSITKPKRLLLEAGASLFVVWLYSNPLYSFQYVMAIKSDSLLKTSFRIIILLFICGRIFNDYKVCTKLMTPKAVVCRATHCVFMCVWILSAFKSSVTPAERFARSARVDCGLHQTKSGWSLVSPIFFFSFNRNDSVPSRSLMINRISYLERLNYLWFMEIHSLII